MVDVVFRLKKTREELSRFQKQMHDKTLDREKMRADIRALEEQISRIRVLEQELRIKKSLLGRFDMELNRFNTQKERLEREVLPMEQELRKIDQERRLGKRF
ncbi:MAG: hypothetical protein WAP23_00375 [Candidatus Spechtbacterales bacterium]